jgi:signal transduction histidine kinase
MKRTASMAVPIAGNLIQIQPGKRGKSRMGAAVQALMIISHQGTPVDFFRVELGPISAPSFQCLAFQPPPKPIELLSTLTHELRTPLNSVLGFVQLLNMSTPPLAPLQQKNLNLIIEAEWHLSNLISDTHDLGLIESGLIAQRIVPRLFASVSRILGWVTCGKKRSIVRGVQSPWQGNGK